MLKLDISENVPLHPQEQWNSCGGACAQMTLEGNPDPNRRVKQTQSHLMQIIGQHNQNEPGGPQWATSPDGLKSSLDQLSQEPTKWKECSVSSRHEALRFIVAGMESHGFPTPVLIDEGAHWVLVVDWTVHGALTENGHLSLQEIGYYDPLPEDVGSYTVVAGSFWNKRYWKRPVSPEGKWKGKYVVVGRP